ncbi:MAG TPA: glycosyltransferase, partial [Flavobacteriales bacterium]|nr:glycosyltransferase [Flavobacteriales bacterium]
NALHIARQTEPGLRLSVIGDGPDRDTLQKLAASKGLSRSVAFLGRLPNTGVLDHMATVSAVIINSRVETFSVVTGEALAQGKPVIATRCGGPMAFVEPGNGILIDIDDDNALAQAMIKITHDAESYDPIKIRAGLSERFSPSVVGETLAKIYTKALND